MLIAENVLGGRLFLLRKGKKSYATVRVAGVKSDEAHSTMTTLLPQK